MSNPFGRSVVLAAPVGSPSGNIGNGNAASSPSVDFSSARNDISDAMAGRVTLAMLDLIILGLIGFYLYTKSAQGGA
jgi:hypothetical protein